MRYRFEKASQMFPIGEGDVAILPLKEWQPGCWAEIPSVIYPKDEETVKGILSELKEKGLTHVVCENIGAIAMAKELGLRMHGGMFLNVLNSEALAMYQGLGLEDAVLSMELNYSEVRKMSSAMPIGSVIYGYLPLMKFRACPGDCKACHGQSFLTDRLGEKFPLICREKKYSELLNCVPLYVADKSLPKLDFTVVYFTIESAKEAQRVASLINEKSSYPGRKTAGLYYRELL